MDTTESLGYLKGLLDGMDLDESKKETKIYRAMIGVLENLAEDVNDLTDGVEMMADQLDAVDEDLGDVEAQGFIAADACKHFTVFHIIHELQHSLRRAGIVLLDHS